MHDYRPTRMLHPRNSTYPVSALIALTVCFPAATFHPGDHWKYSSHERIPAQTLTSNRSAWRTNSRRASWWDIYISVDMTPSATDIFSQRRLAAVTTSSLVVLRPQKPLPRRSAPSVRFSGGVLAPVEVACALCSLRRADILDRLRQIDASRRRGARTRPWAI